MTAHPIDTWHARDLPVLRSVEALDLVDGHDHAAVPQLVERSGLRRDEVIEAIDVLEGLRAVRVVRDAGEDPCIGNLTAIGAAMLAIQAENDLAS